MRSRPRLTILLWGILSFILICVISSCDGPLELYDQVRGIVDEAALGQLQTASTPQFVPASGDYLEPQTVTISCATPGASIRYTTDGSDPTETTGTEIVSGDTVGVAHSQTVKAIAWAAEKNRSGIAEASYVIRPVVPTGLTAVALGANAVNVGWDGSIGATAYEVFRDTNSAGTFDTEAFVGTVTNFTDTGLVGNTIYYYRVAASNAAGSSELSAATDAKTLAEGNVATPTLAPPSGWYPAGQLITITTTTSGASIRYTIDGSTPTAEHGTVYVAPFSVADGATMKAVAFLTGWANSAIATEVYVFPASSTLDESFDDDGIVTTAVLPGSVGVVDLAIQSDGKIIVVGNRVNETATDYWVLAARYLADGTLDGSYGTGGIVTTHARTYSDCQAVVIQPAGEIVVAGSSDGDFLALRYTSAGVLDSAFDADGMAFVPVDTSTDRANGVSLQSDGDIVLAGSTYNGSTNDIAVARLTSAGALDSTFGTAGIRIDAVGLGSSVAQAVAIQSDGKIIVAGSCEWTSTDFVLLRYSTTGVLDTTFGTDGIAYADLTPMWNDTPYAMAIQPDGKILVAGETESGGIYDFALVRFTGAGALDTSFGTNGKVTTQIGANIDIAHDIAVQSNGRIVVVGMTGDGALNSFTVVRYLANGTLDNSFGTGGIFTTTIQDSSYATSVDIQDDGRIVVGGSSRLGGGFSGLAIARYWQ